MSVEKNAGNGTFAALYCAIFRTPSFRKSLKFFGTSIASLDPETVQLPAFSILSVMFTGACGPPEKLSLALVPRSYVLRKARYFPTLYPSHPLQAKLKRRTFNPPNSTHTNSSNGTR